ncbi:MAG: hypothetical protein AAF748_10315 [Pseudomonadota bacterium]
MGRIYRSVLALLSVCLLAACDPKADLDEAPVDFGPFVLGHNITVARSPSVGPGSIPVTEAEWVAAMTNAIDERFGRYDGDRLYHFGISVDGYFLTSLDAGIPGVPSLKSVLALTVTLWDDALGRKLNEEAKEVVVISAFSGAGPFPTKEVLLDTLTAQAAKQIQNWMTENPEWFRPPFE